MTPRVSGCSKLTWGEGEVHVCLGFEQSLDCRWLQSDAVELPLQQLRPLVLGWLWSPWHFSAFAKVFYSFLGSLGILGFTLQWIKTVTCSSDEFLLPCLTRQISVSAHFVSGGGVGERTPSWDLNASHYWILTKTFNNQILASNFICCASNTWGLYLFEKTPLQNWHVRPWKCQIQYLKSLNTLFKNLTKLLQSESRGWSHSCLPNLSCCLALKPNINQWGSIFFVEL